MARHSKEDREAQTQQLPVVNDPEPPTTPIPVDPKTEEIEEQK